MKITHKLLLSFLLVASLASVTTFFTLRSFREIDKVSKRLINVSTPMIEILNSIKQSGLQIVSSTSEYCVLYDESTEVDKAEMDEEEKQLVESGQNIFESSIKEYQAHVRDVSPDEAEELENVQESGQQLIQKSREIVELKKQGISGEQVLEKREEFEVIETAFVNWIDKALRKESEEQIQEQTNVQESIAVATRQTYAVTALTFVLAILSGFYISFLIARPIGKLKDASQKVGAGRLDTQIEIYSKDEIGDLARSFNKMVSDLKESRRDLAAVKTFNERVTDSMVDFVVVLNMDLTIASVNKATLKLNGYEEHELIGQSINILSGDRPFTQKGLDALRKNGYLNDLDQLNLNKDGSLTPISMSVSILKDDKGSELGIVCVGKDVSDRKRSEQALRESELKFRSVTQSAVFAIVAADPKGNVVSWNDGAQNIFGYEEAEILGRPLTILMPKTYYAAHQKGMERHAASGEERVIGKTIEVQGLRKDGSEFPLELSLSSWKKGEESFYSGIISDITERKRAETEREVISEIMQGVTSTANLDELLQLIHRSIERILNAENCFVALYDAKTELLDMQFWVDKYDDAPPPFKMGKGFTAYVCRTGQPMLMTPKIIGQLLNDGEIEVQGTAPAIWLGVPLRTPAGLIGVLTVQHYEDENAYNLRDLEFLVTVGDQIALAIERKQIEKALQASEEQHRLLFEKSPQPAFIFDLETLAFLAVNDAAVGHYGYSREELMSTVTARNLRSTDDSPDALERLAKVRSGKDILLDATRHRKKDGTLIDVEVTTHGVTFAGRRAEIVLVNDVTERKRAEEDLQESEERYRDLIENAVDVIYTHDLKGNYTSINRAGERILGYTPAEVMKMNIADTVAPEHIKKAKEMIAAKLAGNSVTAYELEAIAKDGHRVTVEVSTRIIYAEGLPVGVQGIARDITERRRTEAALEESEASFKSLFETANDAILVMDEGLFRDCNSSAELLFGSSKQNLIGCSPLVFSPPQQPDGRLSSEKAAEYIGAAIAGKPQFFEWQHIRLDGTPFDAEISLNRVDFHGAIQIQALVRDVTERKRAEKARQESEESYRTLFEYAPDGIVIADTESFYLDANASMCRMLGYTRDELIGLHASDIVTSREIEHIEPALSAINAKSDYNREWEFRRKDGAIFPGEVIATTMPDGNVMAMIRDITERKLSQKTIVENEAKFRDLFDNAPVAYHELDVNGRYTRINHTEELMLGYSNEELKGRHPAEIVVEKVSRKDTSAKLAGKRPLQAVERTFIRKDGTQISVLNEDRLIYDELGKVTGIRSTLQDITARKRAEQQLEIFNAKLQQSNRELQDFAYVASHDLQEPLRKVQAFSDRLKTKYADKLEGDGLDYLERMRSAANRMQSLIQDLLTFSRVSTKAQPFVSVNLETITKEVLSDLEVRIEETGATVDFADLPTIDADPMQMRQLMQNLVGNALKFREKGKAPSISIRGEQVRSNGNGSARQCQILVKDNGIGFDEKYTDKIFAVFQRLHGRTDYEGSGVGLAICRKIAERHDGSITAKSRPGDGATFIVTLPLNQAKIEINL